MHAADFIPETLIEATRYFEDLDAATEFVAKMRWPHGIACPRCGSVKHGYVPSRRIWNCHGCRKQFSVKVGTIMEDSPIGLDKWLIAMWLLSGCKNGISSHEIARDLGVSQKTAWFLMHRIRTAMQNGSLEKFDGTVEVDETFIGGKARNMHKKERAKKIKGTGTVGKAVVLGLLARTDGDGPSQVKAKVVSNTRRRTLRPEIEALVEDGATIYTDALKSYDGLDAEYVHATVDHAVKYAEGAVHTNGMENFWSQLDRTLDGSYISVDPDHLGRYVDEQAFRFNNRKVTDSERFVKVAQAVTGKRLTWDELTDRPESEKPRRGGGNRHKKN